MRGGKNQNLSYSSNDVAWSTLDSNILATAATNGVVSVWDLSKFGRQKQLLVYNEHERTAHTVTFHSSEPNILISGSQDGTIKCFDIRCDKSVTTYFSNSESVRDLKFSPHSQNVFSAVSENGTVQLWDLRKWDKCMVQFTAHSGPIYTCDWHPTRNWLATGSRDKQIKVWNMDGRASLEYTIHTIAVVGRVKWRPERTYELQIYYKVHHMIISFLLTVITLRAVPSWWTTVCMCGTSVDPIYPSPHSMSILMLPLALRGKAVIRIAYSPQARTRAFISTPSRMPHGLLWKPMHRAPAWAEMATYLLPTKSRSILRNQVVLPIPNPLTLCMWNPQSHVYTCAQFLLSIWFFRSRRKSNVPGNTQFHLDHSKMYMFMLKNVVS